MSLRVVDRRDEESSKHFKKLSNSAKMRCGRTNNSLAEGGKTELHYQFKEAMVPLSTRFPDSINGFRGSANHTVENLRITWEEVVAKYKDKSELIQ